ncbi:MAG TPA: hypothetical protein VH744_05330, partial [Terriglobales bacterium]
RNRLQDHLRRCARCQKRRETLLNDMSRFQRLMQSTANAELEKMNARGAQKLQQAMMRLAARDAYPPRVADPESAAKRRFAAELEGYLGSQAAAALIGRLGDENRLQDLIPLCTPPLTELLGRKAAAAIIRRVSAPMAHNLGAERWARV